MFITEYVTDTRLYHKCNTLITKTESEINSNKKKTCIFSRSRNK